MANHGDYLSKTSSRFLTETFTVQHNFEVTGYSQLNGMAIGHYISSSKFSAGGYDWNIMFYPDGFTVEQAGYASAYLNLCRGEPEVRGQYKFSLLDMDGKPLIQKDERTHIFDSDSAYTRCWGYPTFFEKPKTDGMPPSFAGDCFTIRCDLKVITHRTQDLSTVVVPQSSLQTHLLDMLKGGQGTDVAFTVGDQLFHAHRGLLAARSPVFKAELFGDMKENDAHLITIDDMEPAIFQALLLFVYTDTIILDECDGVDNNASFQHLFVAADRYGLDRLRAMCELKLCQNIDVHTVATTLALAEQHHCLHLKNACIGFMSSSHRVLIAIQETDGFKHLTSSCPLILNEIIDKAVERLIAVKISDKNVV